MQLTLRKLSKGTTATVNRDSYIAKEVAGREQRRSRCRGIHNSHKAVRQLPRTYEGNVSAAD